MTHKTAKDLILERLEGNGWLSVTEINIWGSSENSIASRLPEMALEGLVESRVRTGKKYKEWRIVTASPAYKFDERGQGNFNWSAA